MLPPNSLILQSHYLSWSLYLQNLCLHLLNFLLHAYSLLNYVLNMALYFYIRKKELRRGRDRGRWNLKQALSLIQSPTLDSIS